MLPNLSADSMRLAAFTLRCLSAFGRLAAEPPRADGTSWPTLHGDLQRSGFYPKFPGGTWKWVWRKVLSRELAGPRDRAIAGGGLVNEWHAPARAIVPVVGQKVLFPIGSQVICPEGN